MKKAINKTRVLILLAVAQFIVVLDSSIVNIALPAIDRDLGFAPENLQWVVTAYTLTFGGFLLLGGRAADLFGRRRLFMIGLIGFTLASFMAGLSQSSGMLIAFRALQGLAAAFMSPAALSIVISTFKEGAERNKALGVWGGVAAAGAAAGLLIGGVLTEYLDWRWNFFVNVPVGIILAFLVPRFIPNTKADLDHKHLDLPGAALATSGLMLLVFGLTKAPDYGWTSERSILMLGASVVLLILFVVNEHRSKHPLMPLHIFKIRNLSGANMMQLPITAGMFSTFFFLSLYTQQILNYSPVKSGLAFLPLAFIIGITSANVSKVIGKVGYKTPMIVGPILVTIGLLLFSRLTVDGSYLTDVLPAIIVVALGLGACFVSITIAATSGVPKHESGLASGLLNTSQQIGGALGLAIISGIFASTVKDSTMKGADAASAQVAGFHESFIVAAMFTISAALIAAVVIRHVKGERHESEAIHIG